ncbi:MAG: pirin family protein [Flavobacteriaceae bacterium]
MKTIKHLANTRGAANHGWLKSHHSFSFANYYNPERMSFGVLRVLNDDIVQPKMGFGTHPHQNMEIISIPLRGALSHKDNMNNKRSIEVGEVQVMSAGTGLTHSEFNDSKTEEVNFLQLWIVPEEQNVTPNYEQKLFDVQGRVNKFQTLVSPQDNLVEGSLGIHQQASILTGSFDKGKESSYTINKGKGVYVFLLEGEIEVSGETLYKRDALGVWDTDSIIIKSQENSEILLIDVPMI